MEEWSRWEPVKGLAKRCYIDFFFVSEEWDFVLNLLDEDSDKKIKVVFKGGCEAYRFTNESYCFTMFGDLTKRYGTPFYTQWSFFKITNSEYLRSLSKEPIDTSFVHYCIFGDDEVIDIISLSEPIVTIIE